MRARFIFAAGVVTLSAALAASFNCLSFIGSKRKKFRTEFGEMRNVPKIVDSRFQLMLEECNQHGESKSEKFIV